MGRGDFRPSYGCVPRSCQEESRGHSRHHCSDARHHGAHIGYRHGSIPSGRPCTTTTVRCWWRYLQWTRQIGHEIIAEGQAFADFNTLLILGSGRQALGTAGHEAVHILTHQAGDGFVSRLPAWLDEGLAEFGNPQPGYLYDIALEFAIETDTLLPVLYPAGPAAHLGGDHHLLWAGQEHRFVHGLCARSGEDPEVVVRTQE